ncbi:MAG: hypothetical protein ACYC3I_02855 [Gemmataceae bacterium]
MNDRRIKNLERQFADGDDCPACRVLLWIEARRLPSGEIVQRDGSPLPPLCACRGERIKQVIVVLGGAPLAQAN